MNAGQSAAAVTARCASPPPPPPPFAARMRPVCWEAERDWYERVTRSEGDVLFTVYERAGLRPIG